MDNFDACGHLSHPDKWYLGAGDRLTWTPPHPQWLDRPGFWDEAHYYERVLAPLFTMTLLTDGGRALPLRALGRDWQPDRLRQTYDVAGTGLSVTEQKTGHETNVLASTFTLKNEENASRIVHVVPWTLQPLASQSDGGVTSLMKTEGQFRFIRQLQSEERRTYDIGCTLGLDAPVKSLSAVSSESGPLQPHWQYTPFYETFSPKALGPDPSPIARTSAGVTYLGLHTEVTITPGNSETVSVAFGAAPEAHQAGHSVSEVLRSAPLPKVQNGGASTSTGFRPLSAPILTCSAITGTAGMACGCLRGGTRKGITPTRLSMRGRSISGNTSPTVPSVTCSRRAGSRIRPSLKAAC
jgi:hypothetical protein